MASSDAPSQPLVTVITVAFNAAATIGATLDSVATQSWPRVEHLVIDGGSTDRTLDIVRERGSHVTHVVSGPDRGIYDAMNKGVALASGDIVCFLNADDTYADAGVLRMVAAKMGSGELDAVFGDVSFFRAGAPQRTIRRYRSDRFRPSRLAYGWMPAHPALFLRRQVFERFGAFNPDYRIAGDFEFIARVFRDDQLRWLHLPQVLVRMQAGGASTSGLRSKVLLNLEVMRACRDNGIRTNWLKILSRYPAKLLEMVER